MRAGRQRNRPAALGPRPRALYLLGFRADKERLRPFCAIPSAPQAFNAASNLDAAQQNQNDNENESCKRWNHCKACSLVVTGAKMRSSRAFAPALTQSASGPCTAKVGWLLADLPITTWRRIVNCKSD